MSQLLAPSTAVVMDTVVTIRLVDADDPSRVDRAFAWFRAIERVCSRFDRSSDVLRLVPRVGRRVHVHPILFETVRFALALAHETNGAFDPTVGGRLEAMGFDVNYRTHERIASGVPVDADVSYRDVHLDEHEQTIMLDRPLVLDLGAVAKGFAIDMAARELAVHENFAIDAGGDLYLAGHNDAGQPWSIGIRHPRNDGETIARLPISNAAICTSGDYLRRNAHGHHHILNPASGQPAASLASVTVTAPLAMVADGLATAAFVLGPERGLALLERHGAGGLLYTPTLDRFQTSGLEAVS